MRTIQSVFSLFFVLLLSLGMSAQMMHNPSLGIAFSANEGQFPEQVVGATPFAAGWIYVEEDGFLIKLYDKAKFQEVHTSREPGASTSQVGWDLYKMKLLGSSEPTSEYVKKKAWTTNFFLGDDESKWAGGVGVYDELLLKNVYEGVHIHTLGEYNNFKYNVLVEPGADADQFRWEYEGVESLKLENGQLVVETEVGPMYEMKPLAWQIDADGTKHFVSCHYEVNGQQVGFDFPEGYDPTLPLTIDPILVFSSYSGSTSDNWGFTATYDDQEYAYGGGIVSGAGYPTTDGAALEDFLGGSWDVGLIKFSQDGSTLEYATYLGGSDTDSPSSLVVDGDELVVLGFTGSQDFPTTDGAFMEEHQGGPFQFLLLTYDNGSDLYVARFSADGSEILNGTFVGGTGNDGVNINIDNNYGDLFRSEVLTDSAGDVYVISNTTSDDFPTSQGAQQTALNGTQDAVIFKLSADLSTLEFSTYWGGSSNDSGYSIEIDSNGDVYGVGGTLSSDLDLPNGGFITDNPGGTDGYIVKLVDGMVDAGTYVGTAQYDQTFFIELDTQGDVWVTGQTEGTVEVSAGVYSNPGAGQFLQRFSPDLTTLVTSTTYGNDGGGSPINICQTAFLVDDCDRIFVSGWGGALNGFGDTDDMPTTDDGYQTTTDGSDFYVIVLDEEATGLLFGSYMGGSGLSEHVDGGTSRFSPKGIIYQAVCAGCGGSDNFPTTEGSWSENNGSSNCNMAVFKYDLEIQSLQAVAQANPEAIGCAPYTVNFTNAGSTGLEHFWDFDDNDATSTDAEPTYTYNDPGEYNVMYISVDEEACNISDTAYVTVTVGEFLELNPDFTFVTAPCQTDALLSVTYTGGPEYDSLEWDFGDNNTSSDENVDHEYATAGEYTVTLTVYDEFCDQEETVSEVIDVSETVANAILTADVTSGCAPLTVSFTTTASSGINGILYFGNGEASQEDNPTTEYVVGNDWEALYIIEDEFGCIDTAIVPINTIQPINLNPQFFLVPPNCTDSTFIVEVDYTGSEYSDITFDMGDGETVNAEEFEHIYDGPGIFTVSVTITDSECDQEATSVQELEIDPEGGIVGEVHWPNVISPNSIDNWNSYFQPYLIDEEGFRIVPTKNQIARAFDLYELTIYNRWGNIVFESSTNNEIWDGQMDGEDVETGVYYWIVRHQLACGGGEVIDQAGYVNLVR